jgi:hypothetical protein
MYEMQRPRPVSRRRPADFSASFAPLDHLPGPATLPVVRSPRSPAGLGLPRAGWPGNYPSPKALSFPKAKRLQVFPAPWLRAFFSPRDPGFPPRPSDSSFPFAEGGSELSFRRIARGFPSASLAQSLPFAGGAGLLLARRPGFALCRVAPGSSLARGLEITHCRVARGFPRAGRLRVSSSPVAPGSSLPEGPDLPFAGWLGVSPLPVARGFPFAGYRPGGRRISTPIAGDRTRGFGQQFQDSLAVHKPSTVNPRLSPATGPSPPNTPQDDPQGGVLVGEGPVSSARGSGRRI